MLWFSHGKQNPLIASEVCVLPICLYGCEYWLLTNPLLALLKNFQAEMGRKLLNLPNHCAYLCPLVAFRWPSMRLRIFRRKLGFLRRLMYPQNLSIGAKDFLSLKEQGLDPLIVQLCILEQAYNNAHLSKYSFAHQGYCYKYTLYGKRKQWWKIKWEYRRTQGRRKWLLALRIFN